MSQKQQSSGASRDRDEQAETPVSAPQASTSGVDDLLDEIDSLLEENAESFVKSFVHKGGQ